MFNAKNLFLKFLHIALALGLTYLIIAVFYIDLDTDGVRIISHSLSSPNAMVFGPEPEQRFAEVQSLTSDSYWNVYIDPIYFTLTLPRQYDFVDIILHYQADQVPFIQLGAQTSATGWNFAWQGVQNLNFENITWPCLHDEIRNWWLCQRDPNYSSIDNFLLAPPRYSRILNYNFNLPDGFDNLNIADYNHLINLDDYDYVIAKYKSPNIELNWIESVVTYNISDLYQPGRELKFVLSAPGINDRGQIIKIKSIDFVLHKSPETLDSIWRKLKNKFKK